MLNFKRLVEDCCDDQMINKDYICIDCGTSFAFMRPKYKHSRKAFEDGGKGVVIDGNAYCKKCIKQKLSESYFLEGKGFDTKEFLDAVIDSIISHRHLELENNKKANIDEFINAMRSRNFQVMDEWLRNAYNKFFKNPHSLTDKELSGLRTVILKIQRAY